MWATRRGVLGPGGHTSRVADRISTNGPDRSGSAWAADEEYRMTAPASPPWSYGVVTGRFLAGCFPGAQDSAEQDARLRRLLDLGIRSFVNLMEADECN